MKEINLKEILESFSLLLVEDENDVVYYSENDVLLAMKELCRQTVALCSENAIPYRTHEDQIKVDKNSILNTINQIK